MHHYVGQKVLITTLNWFVGPDGKHYKAVWGTLKGIHEAGKTLGFIPNRAHANWFLEVGSMTIMGCQATYVQLHNDKPNTERVQDWHSDVANGCKEFERPSSILIVD
jgi:hypothetical protein